ncbi:type VI secretion system tube protein Hcp [Spongisporangium articulatum]|uniref:Type VI secretion system tube protein Hcp n=1 Tax=Spongisporangium articulatum TaxID=3362603 RepID=A0ABW8APZ7_9ACTN
MDAAVRSTRSRRLLPAAALLVTGVAGASVLMTSGADAAPTPTSDITMTIRATTGALAGDTGSTFAVQGFDWVAPLTNASTSVGSANARIGAQNLKITRPFGQGSTSLVAAAGKGLRLPAVEVSVSSRAGAGAATRIAQYKLENCVISDLAQRADANGSAVEAVTLSCNSTTLTATVPKADGTTVASVGQISRSTQL